MELDELKKSWELLDNRLKNKELIDEKGLSNLIAERKKQTRTSMSKMLFYAKTTLIVGFLAVIGLGFYLFTMSKQGNEYYLWLYIWAVLCLGLVWDTIGYMYLKSIDIENMPLVTVVKKVTAYHRNFIIECYVAALFVLSAILIQAICIQLFTLNLVSIILFSVVWIIGCIAAIWILKKFFYNKLRNIKRNLAELRELKQD